MKGAFGALQRVGSQVELRTRIFKGFHRDQLILKEMPGSFEVADGFLKGEFGAVHFRDPLRTLNLQVFVVEQAEQFALANLIANIHWKLSDAFVHFRAHRDLIRGANVASSIDNEANIARLDDSGGRSRRCVVRWLNYRTMPPKEIASGTKSGEHN